MNDLKSKVMNNGRYLEKVYEGGIDSMDQFQSFVNMCKNHVNMCNAYCKSYKPLFWFLNTERTRIYRNFRKGCEWSVDIINAMIDTWRDGYEKMMNDAKQQAQLEDRIRIEHELAIEYANAQYELNRKTDNAVKIGFKTAVASKPKRKRTNKKKTSDE
jgi:hypothetical protein